MRKKHSVLNTQTTITSYKNIKKKVKKNEHEIFHHFLFHVYKTKVI